jgi:heme/copper-type cytochrome/quinol oxidase subunit 3
MSGQNSGTKSTSTAPAESSSTISKSFTGGNIMIGLFSITSVSLFIASFVTMTEFVGSKDDWNVIKPQITKVLLLTLIGTFTLIVASLIYYIQDPAKTIYFILVLCCLSLGLSYAALAISAISR